MDRKFIEDNAIGLKYLRGELSPDELEQFEIYMLDNPNIIEELELDEVLLTGMQRASESSPDSNTPAIPLKASRGGLRTLMASAGSFVLGVVFMVALTNHSRPIQSPDIKYLIAADTLRSHSSDTQMVEFEFDESQRDFLGRNTFLVVLTPIGIEGQYFDIKIDKQGANESVSVAKLNKVAMNEAGELVISLKVRDFDPGIYSIQALNTENNKVEFQSAFRTVIR